MKKLIRLAGVAAILFCLVAPLVFSAPALATADPTSSPTITNVHVNFNVIETGDAIIYGDYRIPYTVIPSTDASEAYIIRLISPAGLEVGAVTPYVQMDSGYNLGIFGFYFESGVVSGTIYKIRIAQNPSEFPVPKSWDYTMQSSAYTSATTHDDNQTEFELNMIAAARRLNTEYEDQDIVFLEASAGGTVLSDPEGENYFRGAIYGIQAMAPNIFLVQIVEDDATARSWTTAKFDTYQARYNGTWVGTSENATANQWGVTKATAWSIPIALLCIGAIVVSSIKFKTAEAGFIFSAVAVIMAALMGWMPTGMFATIFQLLGMYISYLWFLSKA